MSTATDVPTLEDDLNPFVCTLGEAAVRNAGRPHPFKTIPDLIEHQAVHKPNAFAFGILVQGGCQTLTYGQLRALALRTGWYWRKTLNNTDPQSRTIALLGSTTFSSFATWIGLVRLGYTVLLLAPQNGVEAISHLCTRCEVTSLIYEEKFASLAEQLANPAEGSSQVRIYPISDSSTKPLDPQDVPQSEHRPSWPILETDVAYIHHSSGTSGNLPKPLPINHQMAVGVLPFPHGSIETVAIFSTTPLYHGGVADCFRAWTAGCMIWLHPNNIAVTASNVLKSISAAEVAREEQHAPDIKYFSCVPQVLTFMADSSDGTQFLKRMKMVGVGGAPMPEGLATRLVDDEQVNLVSRYGSTECGFLLSSDRDYKHDKDWQYLRQDPKWPLRFEAQDSGLSELVVESTWPGLNHHNRPDGAFATADLFEPHPSILRAWRFHSRADAQLTLSTGKKFDPTPLEDAIRESSHLDDIMIFGNDRPFPGALLFRSASSKTLNNKGLLSQLWPLIEAKNGKSNPHARLSKSMLVVMPDESPRLVKTIKGTTLRSKSTQIFESTITEAYERELRGGNDPSDGLAPESYNDEEVKGALRSIIQPFLDSEVVLSDAADFFDLGLDSNACIRIRTRIQQLLIPGGCAQLPLNVVYDCGDLVKLTEFIVAIRNGNQDFTLKKDSHEDELWSMKELVSQWGNFDQAQTPEPATDDSSLKKSETIASNREVVLLTGVTGTLGAQILTQLRSIHPNPEIHCLVRASSTLAAQERVVQTLKQRGLPPLDLSSQTVHFHAGKPYQPSFGLEGDTYASLCQRVTVIIHSAWAVNFTMRLQSFVKEHIAGMSGLLHFALKCSRSPRVIFCSSMASALGVTEDGGFIRETLSDNPSTASPLGYARSKWVAEQVCQRAHSGTSLHGRIRILRIGQLCGDTQRGVWNVTEAWPLMLSSYQVIGCLPDLGKEPLDWLPVDTAACAVLEISMASASFGVKDAGTAATTNGNGINGSSSEGEKRDDTVPIYNVLNPNTRTTWSDLLRWISRLEPSIAIVAPIQWLERLEQVHSQGQNHPCMKLMDMWRRNYGRRPQAMNAGQTTGQEGKSNQAEEKEEKFEMTNAKREAPVLRNVPPIGEDHVRKIWHWLQGELEKREH